MELLLSPVRSPDRARLAPNPSSMQKVRFTACGKAASGRRLLEALNLCPDSLTPGHFSLFRVP